MGDLLHLIPCADNVIFCRALCVLCRDGTKASFTRRKPDTNVDTNVAIVDIGGNDKYEAVCRKHLSS